MVRKYLTLIVFLLLANITYAQFDNSDSQFSNCDIYNQKRNCFYPEKYPIYDKNYPEQPLYKKLFEFIKENIKYPETVQADKVEGIVVLQFWVDTTGITTEHRITQSVRQDLDDEVLRVAKLIKFDVPAKDRGKSVGMCFQIPVSFSLDKDSKPNRNNEVKSKKKVPK
jgi:TonB family protein